jgi:DNA-binding MarR family transcriptional regulator
LTIGLLARRRCYVSATVDGRKAIEQLLPEGDHRTLDVKREMVLTAGDAAAIVLTLNGAPARPLGKTGEVVTVRVNPANFKDYLSTR